MEFDESHKVIIETLTLEEARDLDREFLLLELARHEFEKDKAYKRAAISPRIALIWESAAIRHKGAIEGIQKRRIKLQELFEL